MKMLRWWVAVPAITVLMTGSSRACTACFGKTDDSMAQGMNAGIFALLAFVVLFWGMFGSFFVFLARKRQQAGEVLPGQHDDPQHN